MQNSFIRKKSFIATALILGTVAILSASWSNKIEPQRAFKHGDFYKLLQGTNLPVGDNTFFTGSGRCGGCHGDDPVDFANTTSEGEDVSPATNWRGTMMANSAKDPMWRSKVQQEIITNPAHAQELINKCTSCHAPVGRYTNLLLNNNPNYTLEELANDSLARDGVNCGACHQQKMEGLGHRFSGELTFHRDTIYGPFISEEEATPIFDAAMLSFVGYMPLGHAKTRQSEMCAGCHTLETNTADLDGNLTGQTFIEQATYHEWLNSAYKTSTNPDVHKECQNCHMPTLQEPIVLASGYLFLQGRQPFAQHWLVGGNTFMLNILKNFATDLGVTATEANFNTVIDRTMNQLETQTATVEMTSNGVAQDTAFYTVKFTNLAGHKFPSGYPSRRAYVEFIAVDDAGNEVFHSGKMNGDYTLAGEDMVDFEPHYDVITAEDEVQIYEMVMGDVNGNRTNILERAATHLKDNRLTPLGFSLNNNAYDTTKIVGAALYDPNFNHYPDGTEGSGTDEIRFHIPLNGFSGNLHVTARLMYQTIPPKYVAEMFQLDNETINMFKGMYNATGAYPVQIGAQTNTITVIGTEEIHLPNFLLFPNPTADGWVNMNAGGETISSYTVYTSTGALIEQRKVGSSIARVHLPDVTGVYYIKVESAKGSKLERVIRN